ncbi:unnamed protein product [Clonostachys rhizophaga]|uniref:Zn(2)-C6 fungal-type domain-containing protein n=1 Tax=Clonostachys rhizophaga TaxID=160324 RepID=A0A9N9VN23_9HYPO|nr:unnamed protein product [Clonostachys rhizophaga]
MSPPTPANLGLTQGPVPLAEVEKSGTAHQHQSDGLCSLLTSIGCNGEAPGGLSLAQRVMNFGSAFLCPCCGFKFLALQDGYQPLLETPHTSLSTSGPYHIEKPPSMQVLIPKSYNSNAVESEQQTPLHSDQPSTPLPQLSGFAASDPAYSPLLTAEASSSQGQGFIGPIIKAESPTGPDALVFQAEHPLDTPVPAMPSYSRNVPAQGGREVVFHQSESLASLSARYNLCPSHAAASRSNAMSRDHAAPHEHHPTFDILQPNQRGGKRGPFKDPSLREQTAQTRKIGSCIRCRMQRIRCEHNDADPTGPCLTCKKVANTRAGRFPCLRLKITDVKCYKPGQVPGYEWSKRWIDTVPGPIQKWASTETKIIKISEGFSDETLDVVVKEFIPIEGDKLERSWYHNGEKKTVSIPPFALVELETVKAAYLRHIHRSMNQAFAKILGRRGLIYRTYQQSVKLCKKQQIPNESQELLRDVFRLWMAVRLSTTSNFIVGEETLGMPKDILDETNPHPGTIPIPPVLGAQLDLILIHHIQSSLRRQVLDRLEKMVSKRKHSAWMVSYLVTFVLLHNAALITAHDAGYARKHGMNRRFAREDKVREYHAGANILLAHFHYCNKNVHPFTDGCKDQDLRTLAGLEEDQIRFVHATRNYAKRHRQEWEGIRARGEVENDYYFVSQLYDENWDARTTT